MRRCFAVRNSRRKRDIGCRGKATLQHVTHCGVIEVRCACGKAPIRVLKTLANDHPTGTMEPCSDIGIKHVDIFNLPSNSRKRPKCRTCTLLRSRRTVVALCTQVEPFNYQGLR
ncbi:hypothetical protein MPTK1_1g07300 [Marchantia polymorpha subsp. ruderalis]|uniref:Uncharacterized protein n=2 Tax=Marchantia polymorpha TaxID=3197 RepID=A0AAF6AMI1_MARPO|nr:hypothetical protein MARPO_0043s0123 [Marchantia polymorpha]BBM97651.1 hypothetical protein Mp_1g07300 [Marchantia polymorpha subsp. ruderalis]|eukprot:PTQ39893.1 hypothetical protein MARPO_0043s0123 [Marchantia polymorpha]